MVLSPSLGAPLVAIRAFAPGDREAVEHIYARSIETANWLPSDARSKTDFDEVSRGEVVRVYVDRTTKILGFISVWQEDSFIHHLYIGADARRQGVGTALIESLGTWLPLPWSLKCVLLNETARRFYAAHGFIEVSTHTDESVPYVAMQRPIN